MCGITGILSATPNNIDDTIVETMQRNLRHRGPDGEGRFSDHHFSGAFRRLSIIDHEKSDQPLTDKSGRFVLFFNGEIYNYLELREHLIQKGYKFRTKGDGEPIIYLYQEYGDKFVERLRGMFALSLWDRQTKQLLLARDRFGEKPLYIYQSPGRLIFSSEIKSLMSCGEVPLDIDPLAINEFFHLNFVHEPRTPLAHVKKLTAAHLLKIDVETWTLTQTKYWSMDDAAEITGDPAKIIEEKLHEAIKLTLRADVPVGLALSGGLDSSAIAAVAQKHYPDQLQAISIGYPSSERETKLVDERLFARELSNSIGIKLHEIEISSDDIAGSLPALISATDDPVSDISGFAYYALLEKARDLDIPVMLFGHGGDELFGGYKWLSNAYKTAYPKYRWLSKKWPGQLAYLDPQSLADELGRTSRKHWLSLAHSHWQVAGDELAEQERRIAENPLDAEHIVFWENTPDFQRGQERLPALFSQEFNERLEAADPRDQLSAISNFPHPWASPGIAISELISRSYLVGNGITQVDRIGMHHSVETRLPLLDFKFAEAVMGLRKKSDRFEDLEKTIFKQALENILPHDTIHRAKKPFRPPAADWFRQIGAEYGDQMPDGYLVRNGILSKEGAEILAKATQEPRIAMPIYFKAIILNIWGEQIETIANKAKAARSS